MSDTKKYENVLKKEERKIKRNKKPKTIEDFMGNLSLDLKQAQQILYKMDRIKMTLFQSFEQMRNIVRLMKEKEWLGEDFDFDEIPAEPEK